MGFEELINKQNTDLLSYLFWAGGIFVTCQVFFDMGKKIFDLAGSSILLKMNQRLNPNRTFFSMQRLGGQTFTAKLLKIGWTKVHLVCEDSELLELSTSEFRISPKKYRKSAPADVGEWAELAHGDFDI